jgi:hypothetical protein
LRFGPPAGTKVLAACQDNPDHPRALRICPHTARAPNTEPLRTLVTWREHFILQLWRISNTLANDLHTGSTVSEGQVIAFVGMQCNGTMLHFEMFDDPGRLDYLTASSNKKYLYVPQDNYQRRDDLLDPTWVLDSWYSKLPATW